MLSIRFKRIGKKKHVTFRLVVLEKTKDPQGDFLEDLGFCNPHFDPPQVKLKKERIQYWLQKGAQATPTVHNLLVTQNILEEPKWKVVKIKKKKEEEKPSKGEEVKGAGKKEKKEEPKEKKPETKDKGEENEKEKK